MMFLAFVMVIGANCERHTALQANKFAVVDQNTPQPESPTPASAGNSSNASKESEKKKDVPPEFKGIDFKNLSYPTSWNNGSRIQLKEGSFRRAYHGGGDTFEFRDVDYVDLAGDGKKEAVVQLFLVECGGSCDGGAILFYFYSIEKNRLELLSRLETGSLDYECGLKSFVLNKEELALELFRTCHLKGSVFHASHYEYEGSRKFIAESITRFAFAFNGKRFVLKKRTVVPNPEVNVMNYRERVEINNE